MERLIKGNCIEEMQKIEPDSVDLVYLDPPFYTQRKHTLTTRDEKKTYEFDDTWGSLDDYLELIERCLLECWRVLKKSGSVFLHCDKTASHHLRFLLDKIFSHHNFRSEIIWSYKRWSNSKKGLLNSHQTIYFYSKTDNFKFNTIYTDYAPTTNVDQILQKRERNSNGRAVYKKDRHGNVILGKEKKGVPLTDVWDIPYLNPKAKERVGYPTQKPVLLLNQILTICTDEGDLVLDPFCGSGTTCVSAKYLRRAFIGIDISQAAIDVAQTRIRDMIITHSELLEKGEMTYLEKSEYEMSLLKSISAIPVQRNNGIDGFLKQQFNNKPIPVRIQKEHETLDDAIQAIENSTQAKHADIKIIIQTHDARSLFKFETNSIILKSNELLIHERLKCLASEK